MAEESCQMCLRSPMYGDTIRKCGFERVGDTILFSPDNRNCATLNLLKNYSDRFGRGLSSCDSGRLWVLPMPDEGGWIVLTGRTSGGRVHTAVYLSEGCAYRLPLWVAEKAIRYYSAFGCSGDCVILP